MAKRRGLNMPVPEQAPPTPERIQRAGVSTAVPTASVDGWVLKGTMETFPLEGERLLIGRRESGSAVDIEVSDSSVSRQHAELMATPEGWLLRDLGSTNGTAVAGERLAAGEARAVNVGEDLQFGRAVLVLRRKRGL